MFQGCSQRANFAALTQVSRFNQVKLTTKGRYAVTAMLDLAVHQKKSETVALADIAKRQGLSQSYLEQLLGTLRRKGLVNSIRGAQGGYALAKPLTDISVAEIILAIEEPLDTTKCAGASNCQKGERCMTHKLWSQLNNVIITFLDDVSLQKLVDDYK